jgi:hypothetical protein
MALVQWLLILVVIEELGMEPSNQNCSAIVMLIEELGMEPSNQNCSVIEECHIPRPQEFDHKSVTQHARPDVRCPVILRLQIMSVRMS